MVKGLHTAALGMLPKTVKMDVIANNIANVNTTGYKKSSLFQRELIEASLVGKDKELSDPIYKIPQTFDIDFSQGRIEETNKTLDLAIEGEGFFVIDTDKGLKYTRNGNFTLSNEGALVTSEGHKVLGEGGEIYIPDLHKAQINQLTITQEGNILLGRDKIDKLQVVVFPEDETGHNVLKYEGHNLYTAPDEYAYESVDASGYRIHQGFLETSNVNVLMEMVEMIQLNIAMQIDQKVIKTQDSSLQQANDVGKLQ
jgi:flagellar basal-body rod protein FlgG